MTEFNIYMTGVGGQGIGLLSQALLRGIDHAGINVTAVDTHGLAQRGGVVVSQIRCGDKIHSPLIMGKQADLLLGMELHEALRGLGGALKKGGTLLYLDLTWQPLPVRLGAAGAVDASQVEQACQKMGARSIRVDAGELADSRMQNMALLGNIARHGLVPGVSGGHYEAALKDLLQGKMLEINLAVFSSFSG